MRLVLVLHHLLLLSATAVAQDYRGEATPVQPSAVPLELSRLRFLRIVFGREGPMEVPLRTPPAAGQEYFVEANVAGIDSASDIRFELADESGRPFQTLPFWKATDGAVDGEFHGFLPVPNHPFRLVARGTSANGTPFRSVLGTLFQPARKESPEESILPPGIPAEYESRIRAAIDAHRQSLRGRAAQAATDHPSGVISLPRAMLSRIAYEPMRLPSGLPIGLRLRYSIQFPSRQTIRATPHVFPVYRSTAWRGMVTMKAIGGSIQPAPVLPGATSLNDAIVYGASVTYESGKTYIFTVDMVPDFVMQGSQSGRFCIYEQKFTNRQTWDALIASDTPVPYSVNFSDTGLSATIPTFFPQRKFYESFAAAGAFDCGPQPNTRF